MDCTPRLARFLGPILGSTRGSRIPPRSSRWRWTLVRRPVAHQGESRKTCCIVNTPDDEREDEDAQDIALCDCVERKIVEEALPEHPLSRVVGNDAFQGDEQKRSHDYSAGCVHGR